MKQLFLTLALAMLGYSSYAQTNAFPSSGNVGIGTTSPVSLLTLNSSSGANMILQTAGSNIAGLSVDGGSSTWYGGSGIGLNLVATSSDINLQTGSPAASTMIIKNNGNVGIGTTTPGSALTIRGSGTGVSIHPIGSGYFGSIAFNRESGTGAIFDPTGNAFQINNGGTDANLHFQVYSGSGSGITGDALVISGSDGSVGINTANTHGYQFAVNGSAIATSMTVKLYASWPDYVFKPSYKLPSLTEVKNYIDKHQHLPEMPSEQEVKDKGINLGEIVKVQTKKIEELTLYLIDQQRKNEEQDAHIKALEAALTKLTANSSK